MKTTMWFRWMAGVLLLVLLSAGQPPRAFADDPPPGEAHDDGRADESAVMDRDASDEVARAAGAYGSDRAALLDEIWRELTIHDAFFDPSAAGIRELYETTRAALLECADDLERLRIVIRALSRLGDGHLRLTTRWFLPDKPPPPIDLGGGEPMYRPAVGFAKFRRDYFVRVPVDADGRAEKKDGTSGVQEYCRVLAIDGGAVSHGSGWTLLNGPKDSLVEIVAERPDGREITLHRARTEPVNPPRHFAPTTQVVTTRPDGTKRTREREVVVEHRRLEDNFGYIRVVHLVTTQVVSDFNAALDTLMDTDGLILDLRGNHGGYPWIMMPIAGRFFRDYQRVCSFDGRSPSIGALVRSVGRVGVPPVGRTYDQPLVVLIDDSTASMSEGLAFTLGDCGRAVLLGRPTMGLNAAIRNTTLKNGLVLWHSWIRVNRLHGGHYQGVGVQPHELVQLDEDAWRKLGISAAIKAESELQLKAAIEKLRSLRDGK